MRRMTGIVILTLALASTACGGGEPSQPGADAAPAETSAEVSMMDTTAPMDAAQDFGPEAFGPTDTPQPEAVGPEAFGPPDLVQPQDLAPQDFGPEAYGPAETVPVDTPGDTIPTGIGPLCFPDVYEEGEPGPDYDQFAPVVGDHCFGTNHQAISDVQRVVFFGDSVSVGTPNTAHLLSVDNSHFYRNLLAEWLADTYGLDTGGLISWGVWKTYDYFSGKGGKMESGDFKNCSKWGARTDDLLEGGGQIGECMAGVGSPFRTLFVFTMGGNDIAKITQVGAEASPAEVAAGYPAAWALAESTVQYLEEAVQWLTDPERFPNGSYVIFVNGFEFTDATGETSACTPNLEFDIPGIGMINLAELGIPVANLAGYGEWAQPAVQANIVIWMMEQYMRIAVDHQVDMIWTIEAFCGHGYKAAGFNADPENRCYIDEGAALYFDETCIHPSDAGHAALFQMFKAVIEE